MNGTIVEGAVPSCAELGCEKPVRLVLELGSEPLPLAYACRGQHLQDVMHATRHLGIRREIRLLDEDVPWRR